MKIQIIQITVCPQNEAAYNISTNEIIEESQKEEYTRKLRQQHGHEIYLTTKDLCRYADFT